jgi:hypothetical protein
MVGGYQVLSNEEADQFVQRGFVHLKGCFSREVANKAVDEMWARLGYDRERPSTWVDKRIHMPGVNSFEVKQFAPKAYAAACDLVGGEERIKQPYTWNDAFIVNLGVRADEPWAGPSATSPGWHKDGDFFRHFLDSPEQGLLTFVLWTDVVERGGATFVACDSVGPVARVLLEHPEGILPNGFDFRALAQQCHDFIEATGEAGDVYYLHPFLLHATAQNVLRRPRVITNPLLSLVEPMRFDREDSEGYSLVERAVLHQLGTGPFTFAPSAPRERLVPEREARQAAMRKAEEARLGGSYESLGPFARKLR